jgi:hypothetical protein
MGDRYFLPIGSAQLPPLAGRPAEPRIVAHHHNESRTTRANTPQVHVLLSGTVFVELKRLGWNFMDLLRELVRFMWGRKKFWLIPLAVMLVLFRILLLVTQGTAIAPFIYTLF